MSRNIKSSFRGYFDELPGIYADNFENANEQAPRAYFLSHYHEDHVKGLHSAELNNFLLENNVKIYTTELTSAIINHHKEGKTIMNYVKVLEMGSTLLMLPGIPEKNLPELYFTVTLIPAGHSAGSTMFLFRTKSQNILYTGDFRVNSNDLAHYKQLHDNGYPITIDALYVDTTFVNMVQEDFPKRSESTEMAVFEIKKWLSCDKMNAVALKTSARYGYEYVFNEIYKTLGEKVNVNSEKWSLYREIPHLVPGVTNQQTRIHLCSNRSKTKSHDSCTLRPTNHKNYLNVHLSAQKWTLSDDTILPFKRLTPNHIDVCFATHCSKSELKYFVDYFKPAKVFGFPEPFPQDFKNKHVSPVPVKKVRLDKVIDKKVDD